MTACAELTRFSENDEILKYDLIPLIEMEDHAIERSFLDAFQIRESLDRLKNKQIPVTLIFLLFSGRHTGRSRPSLIDVKEELKKLPNVIDEDLDRNDIIAFTAFNAEQEEVHPPYQSAYPLPALLQSYFENQVWFDAPTRKSVAYYMLSQLPKSSRLVLLPRIRFKGGVIQDDFLEIFGNVTTDHAHIKQTELILPNCESLDLATIDDNTFLRAEIPVYRIE